jgi:hypothetical protein
MTADGTSVHPAGPDDHKVEARKHDLGDHSNEILKAVDELRSMEQEKRHEDISTPPFHELADAIKDKSREIFRIADEQRQIGESIPTNPESIDDVERTG